MTEKQILLLHSSVDLRWKDQIEHFMTKRVAKLPHRFSNATERLHGSPAAVGEVDLLILVLTPNLRASPFLKDETWRAAIERRINRRQLTAVVICEPTEWTDLDWLRAAMVLPDDGTPLIALVKHGRTLAEVSELLARELLRQDDAVPGVVFTFYSYKGGTGRSMALANVACLLARDLESSPRGVLMIDWDLEAPGLNRFFGNRMLDAAAQNGAGLIELFERVRDAAVTSDPFAELDIDRYAHATNIPGLFLMPAGRMDDDYARRVTGFDWNALFRARPDVFTSFVAWITSRFRYVLIDSRTGLNDTSGICTMLLPERLVVVFTPNQQSLTGVEHLVTRAVEYRKRSTDLRPLLVMPLPSRIELSVPEGRARWRFGSPSESIEGYQPLFERVFAQLYQVPGCDMAEYFDSVQIQHVPRYAYGEDIAVLADPLRSDRRSDRLSMTQSYDVFTQYLIGQRAPWKLPEPDTVASDAVLLYAADHREEVQRIADQLGQNGLRVWLDVNELAPGRSWPQAIADAIENTKALVVFVGSGRLPPANEMELNSARSRFPKLPIVPALFDGVDVEALPPSLRGYRPVDMRRPEALDLLVWGITGRRPATLSTQSSPVLTRSGD